MLVDDVRGPNTGENVDRIAGGYLWEPLISALPTFTEIAGRAAERTHVICLDERACGRPSFPDDQWPGPRGSVAGMKHEMPDAEPY